MSHPDDTSPGPDPLKLPEEGLLEGMPFGDQPADTLGAAPGGFPEAGTAATVGPTVPAEEPADRKKKKREKRKKDRKEKKAEEGAEAKSGPSLLAKISQVGPYTVMLAVALGAMVIAVLVLALYLAGYGFKTHP